MTKEKEVEETEVEPKADPLPDSGAVIPTLADLSYQEKLGSIPQRNVRDSA